MVKKAQYLSFVATAAALLAGLSLSGISAGCSGGSSCDGTTFVNESSETVTVSANSLSGIQFDSFTLDAGEQATVCGDDAEDIMGDYEWPDGDTDSRGTTCSSCGTCIYLLSDHTSETETCP